MLNLALNAEGSIKGVFRICSVNIIPYFLFGYNYLSADGLFVVKRTLRNKKISADIIWYNNQLRFNLRL